MLIVVRGLPGSGKTELVEQLSKELRIPHHLKPDIYYDKHNIIRITPDKVKEANAWCIAETYNILRSRLNCIVSNVFVTKKDVLPYINMCKYFGTECRIVVANGEAYMNNIPDEQCKEMIDNWEIF